MRVLRFLFLTLVFATAATAAAASIPLFFQADKNNIQVLPQRFEYNLADEDHIKIGDIDIDGTTFGFQIAPSVSFPGKYQARFIWPAGLLKEGSLLLKDNTGKAVWTTNFNRKTIKLLANRENSETEKSEGKAGRTQLAELVVDQLNPALIEDMKYFPFMNFCISRTNQDTRIYLCSKELYLTAKDNRMIVRARSQGRRTPFVEINGKSVSYQGVIFLNNESENIGFRAMTQSGTVLEVETRMKPVDFKDVVLTPDKKELVITASGAEPVNEEKVKRLSDAEWQFKIDAERPVLYLKGEGNIPMRQEFYVKGDVPMDAARPSIEQNSYDRIYKPDLTLRGTSAPGTSVSSNAPNEKVDKLEDNRFRWHLTEIPAGEISRHYLRVSHEQSSYLAAYDVYRDFPFEVGGFLAYWTPSAQFYGDLSVTWWMENFMGSDANWSRLHWGLNLKESLMLTKKDGEANVNITHLELLWRATPGFHFQDRTWGLSIPYEVIQGNGLSVSGFGLGAFYSDKAQARYQRYMHWYEVKFDYLTGLGSGDVKLKGAMNLLGTAYYHTDKHMSWSYGLGASQYSFDPGTSKMQFILRGGMNYRF